MSEVTERLDNVEARLGSVETRVESLGREVGELRGEVGELRGDVRGLGTRVGTLEEEMQKLRVLGEETASNLKLVCEVQAHHGAKLEEITKALEPMAEIRAIMSLVAHDHEQRIVEVEKRTGVRP